MERDNYRDFLNTDYLRYENLDGKQVLRLKKYNQVYNAYNELHMNGFEFTHHDVIRDKELRSIFENRVNNLKRFIGRKKYMIVYHHRPNVLTDIKRLITDLDELRVIYSSQEIAAEVILFTQYIISTEYERRMTYEFKDNIHRFTFYTFKLWGGDNQEFFWARCDDDLIKRMIDKIEGL